MSPRMQRISDAALICANEKQFGAYVQSRFFDGGFAFATLADAAQWVEQQRANADADNARNDFRAAIADAHTGLSVTLYS